MNNSVAILGWTVFVLSLLFANSYSLTIEPSLLAKYIADIHTHMGHYASLKSSTNGNPKIAAQLQACLAGPNPLHPPPSSPIQLADLVQRITHIKQMTHNEHCAHVMHHLEEECKKNKAPWCDKSSTPKKILQTLGELYLELAVLEVMKSKQSSKLTDSKAKITEAVKAKSTVNDVLAHLNWKDEDLLGQKADAELLLKEYHTLSKSSWEDLNKKIQEDAKLKEIAAKFTAAKCGAKFDPTPFKALAVAKSGDIAIIVAEAQSKKVVIVCGPGKDSSGQVLINPSTEFVNTKEKDKKDCTVSASAAEGTFKATVSADDWKELIKAGLQLSKPPADMPKECPLK